MSLNNYLDFAENDYNYFVNSYKRGDVANMMGAIAQGVCEKYLKHLINEFYLPQSDNEKIEKEQALRTHNINRLLKYLDNHLNIVFSTQAIQYMRIIDGFYFTTRYPGEDSLEISIDDIEDCYIAIKKCRSETLYWINQLQHEGN